MILSLLLLTISYILASISTTIFLAPNKIAFIGKNDGPSTNLFEMVMALITLLSLHLKSVLDVYQYKYDKDNIYLLKGLAQGSSRYYHQDTREYTRKSGCHKNQNHVPGALSCNQLKEYIPYLQRNELISYDTKKRVCRITMKGTRS
jgi:hypothetical protein